MSIEQVFQSVEVQDKLVISGTYGSYLKLPVLTDAMRDSLVGVAGMLIWNSDNSQVEDYDGSSWQSYLSLAGGTMTGGIVSSETTTGQTTEKLGHSFTYSTDSTYKSANILYSGSTASAVLKLIGTHTNTSGGFYGLGVFVTASNNYAADGDGAIAVRGLVTSDGSTITNGDITGAFFVGKKTGAGHAANSFILYGIEAFAYMSGTGRTGTAIGANFGYHADTSADCSASGSVWRALQVFCDNVSNDAYNAEETTGVYIWAHSGTVGNALCIGTGTGVWTTGIRFVGPQGGAMTTAIKFGGTSAGGTSNAQITTGIDMSETTGMTTMLVGDTTLTSQTTEGKFIDIAYTTDSTWLTGGNITYSGAYTSSVLKIVGTHTGTTGGLHGILVQMIQDQNFTAAAEGIIGIKSYLDMTNSAITEGNFIAGSLIAKKSGSGTMATGAILHGAEIWTYCTSTSVVGTMIGGNIGYHADSSGDCSAAGTVWKALQVFCDNGVMSNPAQETSGVDIWAIAGTIDNALKIGPSSTFTRGILFVGGVGTVTTGIKFGGTAIGNAGNVTMTTGIDMDECTSMTTGLSITATCSTAAIVVGATGVAAGDVKFWGATAAHYLLWDASADELVVKGRIYFLEDTTRTGEGTYLFGDGGGSGLNIGMASPGDCQGIKMEFKYGVSPTLSGDGKNVHGMDIKMTMDQEWNFTNNDRNAVVRGARIQGWSQNDVGGKVMGIYSNARAEGTSKTVEGIIGGTDAGPGVVSLEARTELGTGATITTPDVVGVEIWHNSKTGAELTGDYKAIVIHQPLMPTISGTMYGIWFGDDHNTGYPYDYAFGFSSELDLDQVAHYNAGFTTHGGVGNTVDGWIKVEIDGNPLYLYAWATKPS